MGHSWWTQTMEAPVLFQWDQAIKMMVSHLQVEFYHLIRSAYGFTEALAEHGVASLHLGRWRCYDVFVRYESLFPRFFFGWFAWFSLNITYPLPLPPKPHKRIIRMMVRCDYWLMVCSIEFTRDNSRTRHLLSSFYHILYFFSRVELLWNFLFMEIWANEPFTAAKKQS